MLLNCIKTTNFLLNFILDDDFIDDCDLLVVAIILQKQIECIDGKKENIIIKTFLIPNFWTCNYLWEDF